MLRPFTINPDRKLAPEQWPRGVLQERNFAHPPTPPSNTSSKPRLQQISQKKNPLRKPRVVSLTPLDRISGEFEQISRLAQRFLEPGFPTNKSISIKIDAITEIDCPEAKEDFTTTGAALRGLKKIDPLGTSGSILKTSISPSLANRLGLAGPKPQQSSVSETLRFPTVTKFLPNCDVAGVKRFGAVCPVEDTVAQGPLGNAFYFPNTFSSSSSPPRAGRENYLQSSTLHYELVLCDVAIGSLCTTPDKVVDQAADEAIPAATELDGITSEAGVALRVAGFGSAVSAIGGAPHIAVFHPTQVLPTHIIVCSIDCGADQTPPICEEATPPAPPERPNFQKRPEELSAEISSLQQQAADDAEASIAAAYRRLQQQVRRQCFDLEEAVRARRESLLASLRTQEEAALAAVAQHRRRPVIISRNENDSNFACGNAIKSIVDATLTPQGGPLNPLESMKFDTSRVLSLIESMEIQRAAIGKYRQEGNETSSVKRPSTSVAVPKEGSSRSTEQSLPTVDSEGNEHPKVPPFGAKSIMPTSGASSRFSLTNSSSSLPTNPRPSTVHGQRSQKTSSFVNTRRTIQESKSTIR